MAGKHLTWSTGPDPNLVPKMEGFSLHELLKRVRSKIFDDSLIH